MVLTLPGRASTVALVIDEARWPEIVGTVAGDDTLFIATAGRREQAKVSRGLEALVKETRVPDPIVLAFSGGLDTSFCVPWLASRCGCPVITVTVDTGGLDDEARRGIETRARALGAADHHLVDARAPYFEETLRFLVMGNVLRGHVYPLCVGAERGLQSRAVARIARQVGARAVAHGSTAAGNDQVRFEVAFRTLAPDLEIIAPIRDEGFSRDQEIAWLREHGFDLPVEQAAYSVNRGLWGCTIGGRETTDTLESLPEIGLGPDAGSVRAPAGTDSGIGSASGRECRRPSTISSCRRWN